MKDNEKLKIAADILSANLESSFENEDSVMDSAELDVEALRELAATSAMVDELAKIYHSDEEALQGTLPDSLRAEIDRYSPKRLNDTNVIPLDKVNLPVAQPLKRARNYLAMAASILLLAVAGPSLLQLATPNLYVGDTPMPKRIHLEDGSIVLLSTDSKIRVHYSDDSRKVNLIQGRAYFSVAKNKNRPFIVNTTESAFRAVGTAFDVEYQQQGVKLIVTEGAVQLVPEIPQDTESADERKILNANESALVFGDDVAIDQLSALEIKRSTAWQKGFVFFDDTPLVDIVAEMNKHISGKIIILDSEIGAFRSGGVYQIGSEREMLEAIKETLPIKSSSLTSYLTLLQVNSD